MCSCGCFVFAGGTGECRDSGLFSGLKNEVLILPEEW